MDGAFRGRSECLPNGWQVKGKGSSPRKRGGIPFIVSPERRDKEYLSCYFFRWCLICYFFAVVISSECAANELLRIAGMGGTRIGTSALDAGIFGNPASLMHVQKHNVAIGIASENLRWQELSKQDREQFTAEANAEFYPAGYYSHLFGNWGLCIGYAATFSNFVRVKVSATAAKYDVNQRQFSAQTDLGTDYASFHEKRWVLGVSRHIGKTVTGARLKWIAQDVKQGEVRSTLNLEARHGPGVDVRVPEQLVPAIIEALQFGDRVRELTHQQHSKMDRTANRLELDVGFQREIRFSNSKPLQVGMLFENLLQPNLVEPLTLKFGIGTAYEPLAWLILAADLWRATGQSGINYAIGMELHKTWQLAQPERDTSVALRIGAQRLETTNFSIGFAVTLGGLSTEYTLNRPFAHVSMTEANHLLALTWRL